MIKEIVIYSLLSVYIVSIPCLYVLTYVLKNEIKESRTREDLLEYRINVLTNQILGEK